MVPAARSMMGAAGVILVAGKEDPVFWQTVFRQLAEVRRDLTVW
jgi:hypothetical protein